MIKDIFSFGTLFEKYLNFTLKKLLSPNSIMKVSVSCSPLCLLCWCWIKLLIAEKFLIIVGSSADRFLSLFSSQSRSTVRAACHLEELEDTMPSHRLQ